MADDQVPAWVAQYIGVPFKEHGRDLSGFDCWGLCRHVWREHYGIVVASYAEEYQTAMDVEEVSALLEQRIPSTPWHEVPLAKRWPGDGLLFRIDGRPMHVAVMVSADRFLHVDIGTATCLDRITSSRWNRRLLGVYHYAPDEIHA